jgi:hypothetical protein
VNEDSAASALAQEYSAKADAYSSHWAPVLHTFAARLLDSLPIPAARRLIDVGCGTEGLLTDLAEERQVASV